MNLPRENTTSLAILYFIFNNGYVRTVDVEKFIVGHQGRKWDPKRRCGMWTSSLYNTPGRPGLFSKYCESIMRDGKKYWYLKQQAAEKLAEIYASTPKNGANSMIVNPPAGLVFPSEKNKPTIEEAIARLQRARDLLKQEQRDFEATRIRIENARDLVSREEKLVREMLDLR